MEDKACIFDTQAECDIWDDVAEKFYNWDIKGYLGQPELGLQEQSYQASLFWVKVMELFSNISEEPELGSDVMAAYWTQSEANKTAGAEKDGIGTPASSAIDLTMKLGALPM